MVGSSVETRAFTAEIIMTWGTEFMSTSRLDIDVLCRSVEGWVGVATSRVETSALASALDNVVHLHDGGPCRRQRQKRSKLGDFDHLDKFDQK